ncbi:MAG: hypothetical protein PHE02_10590 [Lachnospiraceae bacterium]|nr:hypothetical protein [Lachnospiraceae bacterium]
MLASGNRKLLADSAKVSYERAMKKAKEEYKKYQSKWWLMGGWNKNCVGFKQKNICNGIGGF